jgi:hypothetical protein
VAVQKTSLGVTALMPEQTFSRTNSKLKVPVNTGCAPASTPPTPRFAMVHTTCLTKLAAAVKKPLRLL